MILFNVIFSKNILELSSTFNVNFDHKQQVAEASSNFLKKRHRLAYIVKETNNLSDKKQKVARQKFIKLNIWQKIFNNCYQQIVFLSLPNKISNKYNTELSYLNIYNNQSNYKYLMSQFSKSLFNGSIKSSLNYNIEQYVNLFSDLEYVWAKGIKWKQLSLSRLFHNNQSQNLLKKSKDMLTNGIYSDHLPLFTVSNHLGQMIISEPPQELNSRNYVLGYNSSRLIRENLYQGWFFTNYEDAIEYKHYISQYYNIKNNHLKIFTCNLTTLFSLINKFNEKICFRLIPDLKEVSQLVRYYKSYKNVSFHTKQKYGRTFFQGQPLYVFKDADKYLYKSFYNNKHVQNYNLAFTNYDTACYTWNQLKKNDLNLDKPVRPPLVVYNLESFIEDKLSNSSFYQYPFLVVPSQDAYHFTKKYQLKSNTEMLYNTAVVYISYIKLWSKRIFWSLTSRQP